MSPNIFGFRSQVLQLSLLLGLRWSKKRETNEIRINKGMKISILVEEKGAKKRS
jgi:hypothetical protein